MKISLTYLTVVVLIVIIGMAMMMSVGKEANEKTLKMPKMTKIALTYVAESSNYTSIPKDLEANTVNGLVDMVEKEINAYCNETGYPARFDFRSYPVIYHRLDGPAGLPEVKRIRADGISLIIGHDTSVLIDGAYEYIHENGMLMMSPAGGGLFTSTDDNFFTLVSPQGVETNALSALMRYRGYEAFVALLQSGTHKSEVDRIADSLSFDDTNAVILYDPNSKDLKLEADMVSRKLIELEGIYGKDHVCLISDPNIFGSEESTVYLRALESQPNLSNLTLFDIAGSPMELVGRLPAYTLTEHRFTQAVPWPSTGTRLEDFIREYIKAVGELPPSSRFYEQAARHDAMWMLALSVMRTNTTDALTIKNILPDVSRSYEGVLGNCTLNEFGSRSSSDCAIFEWVKGESGMEFRLVGYYSAKEGEYVPVG